MGAEPTRNQHEYGTGQRIQCRGRLYPTPRRGGVGPFGADRWELNQHSISVSTARAEGYTVGGACTLHHGAVGSNRSKRIDGS